MKPTTALITIPALSDSSVLAKWQIPGEPVVIVKMTGVGNNQPYDYRAGDKTFRFRWVSDYQGHILRVPLVLWMQNKAKLAHEVMDQRKQQHALIALFEMPEAAVTTESPQTFSTPEMGAADTTPAQNVVGLSEGPTVAPAWDESRPVAPQLYELCEPPKRIKALAALIGVDESILRASIALPESRVEVVTAGWVRRKESQPA